MKQDRRTPERLTRDWALHLALIVRRHGRRFGLYGRHTGKKVGEYNSMAAVSRRLGRFTPEELDRYILRPGERRPK
jgi:hypothetical protein